MRCVLVLVALAVAAPARANVSQKNFPGMRATEPGGLREIAIEHETLTIDLRPIVDRGGATIAATYQLDNRSAAPITAPLVFVSGMSRLGLSEVMFDGKPVPSESISPAEAAKFPAAWSPPVSTPNLDGGDPIGFSSEAPISIGFTVTIPPGKHTLAISYNAMPAMTRSHGGPTRLWQIGYVLSPARDWGSFGTLDVTIEAPPGWRVAASPALARTGDTLRGKFTGLPADTIGISASAPTSSLYLVGRIGLPLLVLLVVFAGGYALFRIGRVRGRSASLGPTWPVALGAAILWAIAIAFAGGFLATNDWIGIPEGQSAAHGYAGLPGIVLTFFGTLLALPVGFSIVRWGIRRAAP